MDTSLIFVGGYPRTGTTLVHALLCGDERTNPVVGECTFIEFLMQAYVIMTNEPEHHAFADYWSNKEQFHDQIKGFLDQMIENFKEIHQCEIPVFKRPHLTPYFSALAEMYPEAKFVATVRHPLDVAASLKRVKRKYLRQDNPVPDPFMSTTLLDMISGYSAAMLVLHKNSAAFGGNRLMYVKYEGLVNYPATVIERMNEFTGLDCRLGDDWKNRDYDKDAPFYSDLWSKGISKKRVGSWKKILNREEVNLAQAAGAFVAERFAYEMEGMPYERDEFQRAANFVGS